MTETQDQKTEEQEALALEKRARIAAFHRALRDAWVGRAEAQELLPKGARRDKLCLEFICGAAVALELIGSDISISFVAMMVATRGAAFLEKDLVVEE